MAGAVNMVNQAKGASGSAEATTPETEKILIPKPD